MEKVYLLAASMDSCMGRTIYVNGVEQDHEEDKKIKELKRELGFPQDDALVYDNGDGTILMSDQDRAGHIPDGARVASQPNKTRMFG